MKDLLYKHANIFIADDDEDDVYFVRSALKELDSEINLKHFFNGHQLILELSKSKNALPNLVILDLNMPILDGRETLRRIRKDMSEELPIVILSTSNHEHEKQICFEYGATSYFTKPCNYSKYLEIIRTIKSEWIDKVMA